LLNVVLGFTHGGKKCNFLGGITVIHIIWKPVNSLQDLFFDAHNRILTERKQSATAMAIHRALFYLSSIPALSASCSVG